MKNKSVKRISMILAALMVAGAATGCGAKDDTKVESTNKVATNSTKLDEDAIKDTYTGIDDMYVLEGSKDGDYLDGVLYDSSIVKGIDVDSSKVDTSKTGNYKITFGITADRAAYDAFRDAFIKSETAKDKTSADKTKTDKKSADKTKTETVKVKKDTVVVNRDEAQKLADQNKLVRTDNGETVKKSDGTEVKTEQKAPASTAVTGGSVVDASAKTEVKPEITAAPAMSPEEAKKEEAKRMIRRKKLKSLLHLMVKTIPVTQTNQILVQTNQTVETAQTASHLANQIPAQTNQIMETAQTASHLTNQILVQANQIMETAQTASHLTHIPGLTLQKL